MKGKSKCEKKMEGTYQIFREDNVIRFIFIEGNSVECSQFTT